MNNVVVVSNHQAVNMYKVLGGKAPPILYENTRWKYSVSVSGRLPLSEIALSTYWKRDWVDHKLF
jgi:hypothetical protein